MEKIIIEDGNNKTSSKNITKGKRQNTNFNHPAYTRYPQMMGKNYFGPEGTVSADYINSEKNLRFSKWEKTFAIKPQKTISGKIVWLKTIYKRRRWMHIEPPQFPVNTFNKIEYAEWEDILNLKMKK